MVRERLEQPPAVGAQARVVLGQMEPEGHVLDAGQEPVRDVLPLRHAARERVAQEPAAQHQVRLAGDDRGDERRDARGVVLVVGVEHHHDVGAGLQRPVVAGLLVPAVAAVLAWTMTSRPSRRATSTVSSRDTSSTRITWSTRSLRDVAVRALERLGGVVGGHDDHDPRHVRHGHRVVPRRNRARLEGPIAQGYPRASSCAVPHPRVRRLDP